MSANVVTATVMKDEQEANLFLPTLLKAEFDCNDADNTYSYPSSYDICSIKVEEEINEEKQFRVEIKKLTISADAQLTFFICSSCDKVCSSRLQLASHSDSNSTECVAKNSTDNNHTSKSMPNSSGSPQCSNLLVAVRPRQREETVLFASKSNSDEENGGILSHMRLRRRTPINYGSDDSLPNDTYQFSFDTGSKVLCHYCGKMFIKWKLVRHKCFSFLKRKFACNLCDKSYHKYCLLKMHQVSHSGKKPYKCDLCKKKFGTKGGLYYHKFSHKKKTFYCDLCDRAYVRKSQLVAHRPVHFGDKAYVCNQCGKSYVYQSGLRKHEKSHKNYPLTCSFCEKKFVRKYLLRNHIISIHLDLKEYVCEQCGSAFPLQHQLRFHLRKHFGIKRFTCDHCDNSYSTKVGLLFHQKKIAGEIEYAECHICNKSFPTKQRLERHMLCHTGKKTFQCEQCGKAFGQRATLTRHMVCHSAVKPYCCQHCGKSYSQVTTYKVHLREHSNVKPFTCYHCSENFTSKDILKSHISAHVSGKDFTCDFCSQSFSLKSVMKKHVFSHIKEKENF